MTSVFNAQEEIKHLKQRLDNLESKVGMLDGRTIGQQLYGGVPENIVPSIDPYKTRTIPR